MKSSKKVTRFDYSKFGAIDDWQSQYLTKNEFWGFHPKQGRLHIDPKRYNKVCEALGATEFARPDISGQRSTVYYTPAKVSRSDYKINIIRDLLEELREEWEKEFKPLLKFIETPKQVQEKTRLSEIAYTSNPDDIDGIEFNALMEGIRRQSSYEHATKALYCSFIQRIVAEVDRFTLLFIRECGYDQDEFSVGEFIAFSDGLSSNSNGVKTKSLSKYNAYNMLHKINNFLKHNSIKAYEDLKNEYPKNVCSVENGTAKVPYQNGMFAGNWIVIKKNYIDDVLKKLILFFEDYCKNYFGEDPERSEWDYDEWFYYAKRQLRDPMEYFGLYFD